MYKNHSNSPCTITNPILKAVVRKKLVDRLVFESAIVSDYLSMIDTHSHYSNDLHSIVSDYLSMIGTWGHAKSTSLA